MTPDRTPEHPAPDLRQAAVQLGEALRIAVETDLGAKWLWPETAKVSWLREANSARASLDAALSAPPAQEQAGQMVSDEQIQAAVFAVLRKWKDDRAWDRYTRETGPYDVTELRAEVLEIIRAVLAAVQQEGAAPKGEPIDMVLFCPKCGVQHIDAPEFRDGWFNPPHRSHLCHGCGHIWRPADVPTNGVEAVKTTGKADSPAATPARADAPIGELTDTQLIDMLRQESMDLRCFDMPTGAGDADIGWKVIDFYMDQPKEREVAVVYHDDPREALRQAYRVHQFKRVAEGPRATPIAAPAGQPVTTAPLLAGRIAELAHRMCTQYAHVERIKYGFTEMHLLDFAWAIEREVLSSAATSSEAAPAPVPDGVWEALQRLIENGLMAGAASAEDARTVAEYRDRNGFIVGLAAPAPVVPTDETALRAGVRQLTLALREREWADLLTTDSDLAALEEEVRKLLGERHEGPVGQPAAQAVEVRKENGK